jgi:hypothetical protein
MDFIGKRLQPIQESRKSNKQSYFACCTTLPGVRVLRQAVSLNCQNWSSTFAGGTEQGLLETSGEKIQTYSIKIQENI